MKLITRCLLPAFVMSAIVHVTWENADDAMQFGMPVNFTAEFEYFNDLICKKIEGRAVCVEEKVVGLQFVPSGAQNASRLPVR